MLGQNAIITELREGDKRAGQRTKLLLLFMASKTQEHIMCMYIYIPSMHIFRLQSQVECIESPKSDRNTSEDTAN